MIIDPTQLNHETVRLAPDAPWVAVIHHPAGSRRWHVHYRDHTRETYKTRKGMLAALNARFIDGGA
jgi:hypothetical protein